MPFEYKGIRGRTLGDTQKLEHLHWSELHPRISLFFAPLMESSSTLPKKTLHVRDSEGEMALCFFPSPFTSSFRNFPKYLHLHHEQFFVTEGGFCAGRRFPSHSPHASHHGISQVYNGTLMHHSSTHVPTLKFLSPLAKEIQRLIWKTYPDLWKKINESLPPWKGIGGSIFQSIALNYRASTVLHRDVSDELPAWIYYFDDFEAGELWIPELGIKVPVESTSLVGLHGKYLFHSVLPHKGFRSSISFYCHHSFLHSPSFSKVSDVVSTCQHHIDWISDISTVSKKTPPWCSW